MSYLHSSSLNNWIDALQNKGYILSKQRLLIMQCICQRQSIPNLENLWLELRSDHHKISWAAYYTFIRLAIKEKWLISDHETLKVASTMMPTTQ